MAILNVVNNKNFGDFMISRKLLVLFAFISTLKIFGSGPGSGDSPTLAEEGTTQLRKIQLENMTSQQVIQKYASVVEKLEDLFATAEAYWRAPENEFDISQHAISRIKEMQDLLENLRANIALSQQISEATVDDKIMLIKQFNKNLVFTRWNAEMSADLGIHAIALSPIAASMIKQGLSFTEVTKSNWDNQNAADRLDAIAGKAHVWIAHFGNDQDKYILDEKGELQYAIELLKEKLNIV